MTRVACLVLLAGLFALPTSGVAAVTAAEARADAFAQHDRTAYTLPPEKLAKAVALERVEEALTIGTTVWSVVQLVLLLQMGIVARMRDVAVGLTRNRWGQNFAFVLLFVLAIFVLDLPFSIYGHHTALRYALSVQGWASWFADKAKLLALEWFIGGLLVLLLFWLIGKSPRRWWLWAWMAAVVVSIAGVFVTPYVIDPLFNTFEPLAQANPDLVARLERVVARGGIAIPPERMFLMKASAKVTGLNAYVTGFGASKRVVVWDTTIAKASPDEIAYIFGHEMGHYALNHIVDGIVWSCALLLPGFWLGYQGVGLLLKRYGRVWGIPTQHDWAALVVFVLILNGLTALGEPFGNAIIRAHEHAADVYGQEAVHGIVADPQGVGRRSFQVLGEESFDDPTPHPLFDLWFATHPSIRYRAAFAEAYDPWTGVGGRGKYFAK